MLAYVLSDIFLFLEKIICIVSSRFKKKKKVLRVELDSNQNQNQRLYFGFDSGLISLITWTQIVPLIKYLKYSG